MRAAIPRLALTTSEVQEFFEQALRENRYPDMNIEIRTGLEMIPGYRRLAGL
jgi:hypothetical protein